MKVEVSCSLSIFLLADPLELGALGLSFPIISKPALSSTSACLASSALYSSVKVMKDFRSSLISCPTSFERSHGSIVLSNFSRNSGSWSPLVRCAIQASYPLLLLRTPRNHCFSLLETHESQRQLAQPADSFCIPLPIFITKN